MQLSALGCKGQIPKVDYMSELPFRLRKAHVFIATHSQITVDAHSRGNNKVFSRRNSMSEMTVCLE